MGVLYYRQDDGTYTAIGVGGGGASGTVAYAQVTADQGSITGTIVDLTGLSATFLAVAGRRYRVTLHAFTSSTVAGDALSLRIMNGAVQLASSQVAAATTPGYGLKQTCTVIITPSAGTITVKGAAIRAAGTGTMTMVANANDPAYILVEDISFEGTTPPSSNGGGRFKSGYWFAHPGAITSSATTGGAGYTMPWFFPNGITIAEVGVYVSTLQAGSTVRIALYADDGNGYPGVLIADLGTIDTSVAGARTLDITNQTLAPGLYWVTSVQLTSGSIASLTCNNTAPPWPIPTAAGVVNSAVVALLTVAHPTAPFATFPTSFSTTNIASRVMLKTA